MIQTVIKVLLYGVLMIALYGIFDLVQAEFQQQNICPKIIGIPACYIILLFALMAFIGQLNITAYSSWLFNIGVGLPWAIALVASVLQFMNLTQCPKSSNGTPMCYLSLLIFSSLFLLKFIENRMTQSSIE